MHSIIDIFGGLFYALFICIILDFFSDWFYKCFQYGIIWGLITSTVCMILCFIYPSKDRSSPTRIDTFIIMGIASGLCLGLSLKYQLKIENIGKIQFYEKIIDNSEIYIEYKKGLVYIILLRSIVGLNLIFGTKVVSKKIVIWFIKYNLNLQIPITDLVFKDILKYNYKLEILYYYFCYLNISFTSIFTCFVVFDYIA